MLAHQHEAQQEQGQLQGPHQPASKDGQNQAQVHRTPAIRWQRIATSDNFSMNDAHDWGICSLAQSVANLESKHVTGTRQKALICASSQTKPT